MALSVVYATINGQIVSENRGGVISYYAPDNLGSTVALLDSTGTVTDTFTYWPYGEIQSHVGSSVTPFTFCGTLGYYTDVLGSQMYVRARYLRQALTRWLTIDPFWPHELAYGYGSDAPLVNVDPSGLQQVKVGAGGLVPAIIQCMLDAIRTKANPDEACFGCCLGAHAGTYASCGAYLGSPEPGAGNIIGGAIGVAIGYGAGLLACGDLCDIILGRKKPYNCYNDCMRGNAICEGPQSPAKDACCTRYCKGRGQM